MKATEVYNRMDNGEAYICGISVQEEDGSEFFLTPHAPLDVVTDAMVIPQDAISTINTKKGWMGRTFVAAYVEGAAEIYTFDGTYA